MGKHGKDEWRYDGPTWPSATAMLSDVANALANGIEIGCRRAVIADGRLDWPLSWQPPR
ncbi:hypothetical protein M2302_002898 [Micromonospora sp. A200]|uniref:hypothetical protein n=1 Tax=Micromonospora sp. A200 TaxID=2940568 RepID=UPI002476671F|nr:hypothetical protein [Micromonospora sp. A200]MDH6462718.1 hypothetical protein [Micromonospora sp. A200]